MIFDSVLIDRSSEGSELAKRAKELFPDKIKIVEETLSSSNGNLTASEYVDAKKTLLITTYKGKFFKRCPGAHGQVCCNYHVLNLGFHCNMDCSYCYLQGYLNTKFLTVFSNIDDAFKEMDEIHNQSPTLALRIGTGETTDSLSLDSLTKYSRNLVDYFSKRPHWTLEFKTKSDVIGEFVGRNHSGNVQVSWSINPQTVVEKEEHGTASLEQRLLAAKKCVQNGFKVTFNFDPVIWFPKWEQEYTQLVDEIATNFRPSQIPYITLGALRFPLHQKRMMRDRFSMKSLVLNGEMFQSSDGKLRYDLRLRNLMFQTILKRFKFHSDKWVVMLCMETPESWLQSYGGSPLTQEGMEPLFRPKIHSEGSKHA